MNRLPYPMQTSPQSNPPMRRAQRPADGPAATTGPAMPHTNAAHHTVLLRGMAMAGRTRWLRQLLRDRTLHRVQHIYPLRYWDRRLPRRNPHSDGC